MTAINGDGDPITIDTLADAVGRILEYSERDISAIRFLLEADEGICASDKEVALAIIHILSKGGRV